MPRPREHTLHNPGAPITLTFGDLAVTAFAIAGLASFVMVPSYDACFDLGHCPIEAASLDRVFLTHVHQDHSLGVFRHHALRAMNGMPPARVYVPRESVTALHDAFVAMRSMEGRGDDEPLPTIVGVSPGDEIPLPRDRTVQVFDVRHRIASRGYTVWEERREPRPAFRDATREVRRAARIRGEIVDDVTRVAAFTYIGDSTLATLRAHPEVGASEVLFLEATYLAPTERHIAAKWGHTHLDEIVELMRDTPEMFRSRAIVLKHFSTRYGRDRITAALEAIPPGLRERVIALI